MITGRVTAQHDAMVRLVVLDRVHQPHDVDAVIDTGFNGFLTLPRAMAHDAEMRQVQARHTTFAARLAHLTRREREVLDLVLAGLLNKQIALRLAISQRTVELHRSRIMQKLHAESAADLARQVLWAQGT